MTTFDHDAQLERRRELRKRMRLHHHIAWEIAHIPREQRERRMPSFAVIGARMSVEQLKDDDPPAPPPATH